MPYRNFISRAPAPPYLNTEKLFTRFDIVYETSVKVIAWDQWKINEDVCAIGSLERRESKRNDRLSEPTNVYAIVITR